MAANAGDSGGEFNAAFQLLPSSCLSPPTTHIQSIVHQLLDWKKKKNSSSKILGGGHAIYVTEGAGNSEIIECVKETVRQSWSCLATADEK